MNNFTAGPCLNYQTSWPMTFALYFYLGFVATWRSLCFSDTWLSDIGQRFLLVSISEIMSTITKPNLSLMVNWGSKSMLQKRKKNQCFCTPNSISKVTGGWQSCKLSNSQLCFSSFSLSEPAGQPWMRTGRRRVKHSLGEGFLLWH